MSNQIDVASIYRTERQRWIKTEAPRPTFVQLLSETIPYFIVIVALGAFLLSAPHTAGVLDQLTPGFGWVAPVFVEFTLVFLAFRRKQLLIEGTQLSRLLVSLRLLAFVTAVITNFTGALVSVVSKAGLETKSGTDIIQQFGTFPITTQAGLIMVCVMAFVIPIVAEVAGHEVAELAYRQRGNNFAERQWREVEKKVIYRAVFVELNRTLSPDEAQIQAQQLVGTYLGLPTRRVVPASVSGNKMETGTVFPSVPETFPETVETRATSPAVTKTMEWLIAHPDAREMSVRQAAQLAKVSSTTMQRAMAQIKVTKTDET